MIQFHLSLTEKNTMSNPLPNVDRAELPRLAELIDRYASRYERRQDGSHLWEGRVRDGIDVIPTERWEETRNGAPGDATMAGTTKNPTIAGTAPEYDLIASPISVVAYYGCAADGAILHRGVNLRRARVYSGGGGKGGPGVSFARARVFRPGFSGA